MNPGERFWRENQQKFQLILAFNNPWSCDWEKRQCKRQKKQYQPIQPVTSFEWPTNCLTDEDGSETLHTVKVPSDAPNANRSELMWPNFTTITAELTISLLMQTTSLCVDKKFEIIIWPVQISSSVKVYQRLCIDQIYNAFLQRNMQIQLYESAVDYYHLHLS